MAVNKFFFSIFFIFFTTSSSLQLGGPSGRDDSPADLLEVFSDLCDSAEGHVTPHFALFVPMPLTFQG